MPRRSSSLVLALLLAALAFTLVAAHEPDHYEPVPQAVVAFVDTGINPYHEVFRDDSPRAFVHPSTYLEGFPEDAEALYLSLDAPDYQTAVGLDADIWESVDARELYWIPGTRIVGAITFGGGAIRDTNGHGTMVASRGAGAGYGACQDCLIVAVQAPMAAGIGISSQRPPEIDAFAWAGDNADWIDAQSNSWGPIAPGYDPTNSASLWVASEELISEVERVSQTHLAFWASGNGAAFRGGVLGHPTLLSPHLAPSAISVGGHDSGYVNTWPGFWPHLVSDSCAAWAAHDNSMDQSGDRVASGTSGATPYAAGGAARILLEARRILGDLDTGVDEGDAVGPVSDGVTLPTEGPLADGTLTLAEWREVTFDTATERPLRQQDDGPPCGVLSAPYNETPVQWKDVPEQYPEYLHIGYGAVDRPSMALAFEVLRGEQALPDRSDTDQFFTLDDAARSALHTVWTLPGA